MTNDSLKPLHSLEGMPILRGDYLLSLLQAAVSFGAVSDSGLESIQVQLFTLLAEQTRRYTGGASSSVRTETAQHLMQSLCYTISVYLKGLNSHDAALQQLLNAQLPTLFDQGQIILKRRVSLAKHLLQMVQKNRILTPNLAYNDTISNGLPLFFRHYDLYYSAHESPGSVDYPLGYDRMDLTGVEAVFEYLSALRLENQFCQCFDSQLIHRLILCSNPSYAEDLQNICQFVLLNSLGRILCDKSPYSLWLNRTDLSLLRRLFSGKDAAETQNRLTAALKPLLGELHISSSAMEEHLTHCIANQADWVKYCCSNGMLQRVFLTNQ